MEKENNYIKINLKPFYSPIQIYLNGLIIFYKKLDIYFSRQCTRMYISESWNRNSFI